MATIRSYGVGTGYNSDGITGSKTAFNYDEKIYACHVWDNLVGNETFYITFQKKIGGNYVTQEMFEWKNTGNSSAYQYAWIKDYPSGDWKATFYITGGTYYQKLFNIRSAPEPGAPDYQDFDIQSTPSGAEIWEAGKFLGTTPFSTRLSYDNHTFLFKKSGYKDLSATFPPRISGDIININVTLIPAVTTGGVEIISFPSGAKIYRGTQFLGTTPFSEGNLSPARYTRTLKLEGYNDLEFSFIIMAGQTQKLNLIMTKIAIPEEEESFWTKLYYSVEDAKKIIAWIIANLRIPSFAEILKIIRGIEVTKPGAGYKVLPTPPTELKTKGRELYLLLDNALYNKDTNEVIEILKEMAVTENNPIPILAVILAVTAIVGTLISVIGSYPFSNFLREESLQSLDFAIMVARQNKDIELYAKLIQFKEDLLERTLWEKILYAIPFVNIVASAWEYYDSSRMKLEADKVDFEKFKEELEGEIEEKTGTLTISPIPADAKVSVTGQIPTTGTFNKLLPAGVYSWVVSLFGYTSQSGTSEVKENLETLENIILLPVEEPEEEITRLTIATQPADANIEISAYPQITTPGTYSVAPGTYSIRIYKEGYKDYVATIYLNKGDSKTLSIILSSEEPYIPPVVPPVVPPEIPGVPEVPVVVPLEPTEPFVPPVYNAWKYTITAIDSVTEQVLYAQLLVDGVSQEGYTPMSIYLLPESRYILTLRKKGYKQGVVEINTEALPI